MKGYKCDWLPVPLGVGKKRLLAMYVRYDDILNRINEPPRWWGNGVPRYKEFEPSDLDHAMEAMLIHVKCQSCGTNFDMGVGSEYQYDSKDRDKTFENALRTGQRF
ncbi:hypothetical protein [Methylobacterium sp. R2-1]|uniref:hypothetical protein n=1 Tax=Methylobacterium sp. R2-1 TaxID=2587064 RepID=UPI00160C11D3|nr:hypothetical protein [Methylobacterium sp. R2-1]MBB2964319.1 hypothetical protein [Methylobacterium sp. R2-1]